MAAWCYFLNFLTTFRAAQTQALGFAWIMAVVQRANPVLIFSATLKATELTDSHTDSCGSLSTRTATSWTVKTGVMWWHMMPNHHHIYQSPCDQGDAARAFTLMLHVKNLIFGALWVSENTVEALDVAKWCRRCSFAKVCQHVYTLAADSQEQN